MHLPILLIIFGLLLYLPSWSWIAPWARGEVKEVGRIIFFCGMLTLAFMLKGTRFF